jgi:osmotically inducible protein OsmC
MPRIVREADVSWEGNVARGRGQIIAASSGAFTLPYSLPTRIGKAEGKTSPEELLAAAHGGCFSMSLAGELTGAGIVPTRIDVHCRITMDEVQGEGHQIVHSQISITVDAPDATEDVLATAVDAAHAGCSFSALLRKAGVEIEIVRG